MNIDWRVVIDSWSLKKKKKKRKEIDWQMKYSIQNYIWYTAEMFSEKYGKMFMSCSESIHSK